jgi:uncharacterized membrane protein
VRAAARTIALIVAGVLGLTLVVSALAGALLGVELGRAVSTGLYVVGCFFVVLGFFAGVRGPVRPRAGTAVASSSASGSPSEERGRQPVRSVPMPA